MSSLLKPFELDLDITSGQLIYAPMPNFSYSFIPENCCIVIPEYQEMLIFRKLSIDGKLVCEGNLVFIE